MSLLTNKQLKTHRTVQLPMINAPTNAIDGGPQSALKRAQVSILTRMKPKYEQLFAFRAN